MVAFMALSPAEYKKGIEYRRWTYLYQTTVWCLWKAYLSHSFDDSQASWQPEAAEGYYRETVKLTYPQLRY